MTQEDMTYLAGYDSYDKRGESRTSNPYSDEAEEFQWYDDGWCDARNEATYRIKQIKSCENDNLSFRSHG